MDDINLSLLMQHRSFYREAGAFVAFVSNQLKLYPLC